MALIQFKLSDDEDYIVELTKARQRLVTKADAVKYLIKKGGENEIDRIHGKVRKDKHQRQ